MGSVAPMLRPVALLLLLTVAACGSPDGGVVAEPGDLGHVHDMVLDDDGALLVATHSGLYRIEGDDRAVLVGPEQHDLMAMVRLGDGSLVASGHPDLRLDGYRVEGLPPLLGLVRSNDSGESWQVQDLLGEADFHAMVAEGDSLYVASSSGQLAVRRPASGWQMLGNVSAADLAVAPGGSGRMVATDYEGVLRGSADAFAWDRLEGVPSLVQVEWPDPDRLIGIDLEGTIWAASAPEGPWVEVAVGPARPETLMVDASGAWWVAARGGVISRSDDDGVEWVDVFTEPTGP